MILNIPAEYRDKLEVVEPADRRTDEEVFATLLKHTPVTSEKNVWAYWDSGISTMPKWNQRNVIDWVRILGPEWTVRVLDSVEGSVNNVLQFVPESLMPPAFVDRTMDGPFVGQHGADLTRTSCLYEHGGVWMDVGSLLIRHLDRVCWNELEDPNSPYKVAATLLWGTTIANWFVAARKNDPFIYQWHRLFVHLWGEKKNIDGMVAHPLMAPLIPQGLVGQAKNWDHEWIDANVLMSYVTQITCITRLFCLEDNGEGFSGVDYWRNNFLALNAGEETTRLEWHSSFVGFSPRALDMLVLPCSGPDADPTSEKYKEAESNVYEMLANASMWKNSHGKGLTHYPLLGSLLDQPENENKDATPNTFGALLRYGTRHLRQKRDHVALLPKVEPMQTWKKGVLEEF